MTPVTKLVTGLVGVAIVSTVLDLPAVASAASITALGLPLWTLSRRYFSSGSRVTPMLAAFILFLVTMLVSVEVLSAATRLGSRVAWVGLILAFAAGLQASATRDLRSLPSQGNLLHVVPLRQALREPWAIVVIPLALLFGIFYVESVYLNLFTGINHPDGQTFYMVRSIRYLQDGTLTVYGTPHDFLPHFHQTLSAYLLLFFGSESSILLLSSLFGGVICLAVFDLSRLLRFPASLSLLAGVSPLSVTIFNLHLGTSNFDVHMALFLLLVIYFLLVGIRTSQTRYLLVAASATCLALATKLTFWFAAPALIILWIAATVIIARQRGVRAVTSMVALSALIVALGGLHFVRNAWYQGFLVTPSLPEYGQSDPTTWRERFDVTVFHMLASTTTLLTPEALTKHFGIHTVVNTFKMTIESMGISLPNPMIFTYPDRTWDDVFDHLRMPFRSDKAGFGVIIPFVLAPSVIFVMLEAIWYRRLLTISTFLVVFAFLYLLTLSLTLKYAADHVRYMIEMVVPLLALIPAVLARLPVAAGCIYLVVAGGFMAVDVYQAHHGNDLRPPTSVLLISRKDQFPEFNSVTAYGEIEGARIFNRKYPVDTWPEFFLLRRQASSGEYLEYPFFDTLGRRRLSGWATDLDQPHPPWPGPMLILDQSLAGILSSRFPDQVALDRLSSSVWVGLPLDRLRVLWEIELPETTGPPVAQIEARVAPRRYLRPEFRFMTVHSTIEGTYDTVLREFSDDATFAAPLSALSPVFDLRVDVREAGDDTIREQLRVPQRIMFAR